MLSNMKLAVKTMSLALGALTLGAATDAHAAVSCTWRTVSTISSSTSTSVLAPGGSTAYPAYVVTPDAAYSTISGTSWINYNPNTSGFGYSTASYYNNLWVPNWSYNTNDMRVKLEVNADNAATFFINGTQVYQQSQAEISSNFQSPAEVAYTDAISSGAWNYVQINVTNFSGPTGLNYRISVQEQICTYTDCEPSPQAREDGEDSNAAVPVCPVTQY